MRRVNIEDIVFIGDDGIERTFYFDANNYNYLKEIETVYFLTNYLREYAFNHSMPELYMDPDNKDRLYPYYKFQLSSVYDLVFGKYFEKEVTGEFIRDHLIKLDFSDDSGTRKYLKQLFSFMQDKYYRQYFMTLTKLYYGIDVNQCFGLTDVAHIMFVKNDYVFIPLNASDFKHTINFGTATYFNRFLNKNNDSEESDVIHVTVTDSQLLKRLKIYDICELRHYSKRLIYKKYKQILNVWSSYYGNKHLKIKLKVKYKKPKKSDIVNEIVDITIKFPKNS